MLPLSGLRLKSNTSKAEYTIDFAELVCKGTRIMLYDPVNEVPST